MTMMFMGTETVVTQKHHCRHTSYMCGVLCSCSSFYWGGWSGIALEVGVGGFGGGVCCDDVEMLACIVDS
jgi:hypothetical protein